MKKGMGVVVKKRCNALVLFSDQLFGAKAVYRLNYNSNDLLSIE